MCQSCISFLFYVINYYKSTGLKHLFFFFFFNLIISIGQKSGHSEFNCFLFRVSQDWNQVSVGAVVSLALGVLFKAHVVVGRI